MRTSYLILVCCLLSTWHATAQPSKLDTTFLSSARDYEVSLYNKFIHGQSRLYNGSEYRDFFSKNDEHPYFGVDDWTFGDIVYDEELYKNIPLFYDIYHDKVITEHLLNGAKLELISEKVESFSFSGHTFVRLQRDEAKVIAEGFYDRLYDGRTKVYCRREKQLQQKIESNDIISRFDEKTRIYILSHGTYFPVRKKGSVLDVMSDRKQELKSFLKKDKISFKADREQAIVRLAEHYDSLK